MRKRKPRGRAIRLPFDLVEGVRDRIEREGKEAVVKDIRARRERAKPILDVIAQRVGPAPRDRLAWVVRAVQRPQKELTPGDWDNLRLEIAAFIWPVSMSEEGSYSLPTKEEVQKALSRMGEIIEAAVKRQPVTIGRYSGVDCLLWDPKSADWVMDMSGGDTLSWADAAAHTLGHLLLWGKVGPFLKECPAPAVRGKEGETCGEWFVAKRPNQDYCSATCQSRASTRAKRAGTPTPAALKRREAEKEG